MRTALLTAMPRFPFYPVANISFFWSITLKSCWGNWSHCVSHIKTVFILLRYQFSGIFFSRLVKCLKICKEQSALTKATEEWTESQHRGKQTLEEKVEKTFTELFPKKKMNATQWINHCRKN